MTGPPREPEEFDPGLARERTRLAWTRTAVAFVAVGAAILKTRLIAGLIVLALAAVVWGLLYLFRDTFRGGRAAAGDPGRLAGITATVVAVAVVALVIAFLGHFPVSRP